MHVGSASAHCTHFSLFFFVCGCCLVGFCLFTVLTYANYTHVKWLDCAVGLVTCGKTATGRFP